MSGTHLTGWLLAAVAAGSLAGGCRPAPAPLHHAIEREWAGAAYDFCIGVYTGASPLALQPRAGVPQAPVFTGADVPYTPARFVADPFVVRRDGTWYLFFELFNAVTGQGDIALATSRDGWQWQFARTVLNEPFHLSYPLVFEWRGAWYMLPEGQQSGVLTLYRATAFPLGWEPDAKLLDGSYVDSTLLAYGGHWWLFTTPNGSRDLLLFMADNPRGPWTPHPASPLQRNNGDIARSGGRFIVYNGVPLRFTQDVDPTYGNALRAFRITTLTPTAYAEEPATPEPILNATGRGWRAWGMHQLDPVELAPGRWLALVDGVGPALPDTPLAVAFANGVTLDGVSVRPRRLIAGGQVLLRFFLSGLPAAAPGQLAVFVHVVRGHRSAVVQADFALVPGQEFYEALVRVPAAAPAGDYDLKLGLYRQDAGGQRVPLKAGPPGQSAYRVRGALRVEVR